MAAAAADPGTDLAEVRNPSPVIHTGGVSVLSPNGRDHFPVVFDKIASALLVTEATLGDLATITAPTLIMAGDDDLVAVEHLEAMRTTVAEGQLAIVPGTSHGLPLENPNWSAA